MKLKGAFGALIFSLIFLNACEKQKEDVHVHFTLPPLQETGITGGYIPEGLVFKLMLSCTAVDMKPVTIEDTIDYTDTTTGYEWTITVPMGKARHFSAMIYAVGPDPTKHPKTYFLAGDGGYVDTEQLELTVEINMLYLIQFVGDTNIYVDSQDRVWFAITPLYQYKGGIGQGLKPQQFKQVTQGGVGVFDGAQFFFVSLDSIIAQRGLDFSQSFFYLTDMDGNDNTLWLGSSQGVFVFDIQSMQFVDFYDVGYVIQVMVKRFQEGAGSEVWFLMDGGIVVNNFAGGTFNVVQGSQGNSYHFITEDPTQPAVYAGKYYDASLGVDYNLSIFNWDGSKWASFGKFLDGSEILTFYFEPSNYMWLSVYDYSSSRELLLNTSLLTSTLMQLSANFIYLTGQNSLGLNGINYNNFQYNVSDINSFENIFYFGSDGGLITYDKSLNEWNLLERINAYIFDNYVRGIKITSYGDVWFTSGPFPTVLPAGVKTGERVTRHPDSSRVVDAIGITNNAMSSPSGIAISPDGQKIYTGWQDYISGEGRISEIDLTNKSKSEPDITLVVGVIPYYVRLSPDGSKLFASDSPGNRIWVVDLTTKSVTPYTPDQPFGPFNFEVSSDGKKGFFLNDTASPYGIRIVDLASSIGTVIADIPISDARLVSDMVVTSDESTAYVSGMDTSYYKIYKVDLVNRTANILVDFSSIPYQPNKLLLDEKNNRLIVSGLYVDVYQLAEIPLSDPLSYIMHNFPLPGYVNDMLLTPDADLLFITYGSDYFQVFDVQDLNIIRSESPYTNSNWQGGPMVSSYDGKTVYMVTGYYVRGYQLNLESIK